MDWIDCAVPGVQGKRDAQEFCRVAMPIPDSRFPLSRSPALPLSRPHASLKADAGNALTEQADQVAGRATDDQLGAHGIEVECHRRALAGKRADDAVGNAQRARIRAVARQVTAPASLMPPLFQNGLMTT